MDYFLNNNLSTFQVFQHNQIHLLITFINHLHLTIIFYVPHTLFLHKRILSIHTKIFLYLILELAPFLNILYINYSFLWEVHSCNWEVHSCLWEVFLEVSSWNFLERI